MRITAHFYSADSAEFAASALRRNLEGISGIKIIEKPTGAHRDNDFAPIGFFMNMNTANVPGVPVHIYTDEDIADVSGSLEMPEPRSADVEVICRPRAARRVSSVLINKGGHELRGDSI